MTACLKDLICSTGTRFTKSSQVNHFHFSFSMYFSYIDFCIEENQYLANESVSEGTNGGKRASGPTTKVTLIYTFTFTQGKKKGKAFSAPNTFFFFTFVQLYIAINDFFASS